jgi:hypothetical protein
MASMHPRWHARVFPDPQGATAIKNKFPFSSYVANILIVLLSINALVDVKALINKSSQ